MQFSSGKKRSTKWPEKWIWKGLGLHLGEVWDALGHLLATFGRILVVFGRSKSYLFKALVQDELQEAFWVDFGLLLEGFGRLLGRVGNEFGRIWGFLNKLWADFTHVGTDLALLGQSF